MNTTTNITPRSTCRHTHMQPSASPIVAGYRSKQRRSSLLNEGSVVPSSATSAHTSPSKQLIDEQAIRDAEAAMGDALAFTWQAFADAELLLTMLAQLQCESSLIAEARAAFKTASTEQQKNKARLQAEALCSSHAKLSENLKKRRASYRARSACIGCARTVNVLGRKGVVAHVGHNAQVSACKSCAKRFSNSLSNGASHLPGAHARGTAHPIAHARAARFGRKSQIIKFKPKDANERDAERRAYEVNAPKAQLLSLTKSNPLAKMKRKTTSRLHGRRASAESMREERLSAASGLFPSESQKAEAVAQPGHDFHVRECCPDEEHALELLADISSDEDVRTITLHMLKQARDQWQTDEQRQKKKRELRELQNDPADLISSDSGSDVSECTRVVRAKLRAAPWRAGEGDLANALVQYARSCGDSTRTSQMATTAGRARRTCLRCRRSHRRSTSPPFTSRRANWRARTAMRLL